MCRCSPLVRQGASRRTIVKALYTKKSKISRGKNYEKIRW